MCRAASDYIREATALDVDYLGDKLRREDVEEAVAGGYKNAYHALCEGLTTSCLCLVLEDPDIAEEERKPAAILGVTNDCLEVSTNKEESIVYRPVWMVATDTIVDKYAFKFLRYSREIIDAISTLFGTLGNYADTRNTTHIKWLEWCGFKERGRVKTPITVFALYIKEKEEKGRKRGVSV